MSSLLYHLSVMEDQKTLLESKVFILAYGYEDRSLYSLKLMIEKDYLPLSIIVFNYEKDKPDLSFIPSEVDICLINLSKTYGDFLDKLLAIDADIWKKKIVIDISCIRIPELFPLMKFLKIRSEIEIVDILYSIPYDYSFSNEPFTSFKTYDGDLEVYELMGFSGLGEDDTRKNLLIYIGFEGSLSLKIAEEISYQDLTIINNFPSYSLKYKDISIVNNYHLIIDNKTKIQFSPADNPYEVYNILHELLKDKSGACIAPLSTKPVALGVCMYALDHDNIRVVYPISMQYNSSPTSKVYRTFTCQFKSTDLTWNNR